MGFLVCLLIALFAAGCVPNSEYYVHDGNNPPPKIDPAARAASINQERAAQLAAMNQMTQMFQGAGQPAAARPGRISPNRQGNLQGNQQGMAPELQAITDYLQACQDGDMSRAATVVAENTGRFSKDPKQAQYWTQMAEILKNQEHPQGVSAGAGNVPQGFPTATGTGSTPQGFSSATGAKLSYPVNRASTATGSAGFGASRGGSTRRSTGAEFGGSPPRTGNGQAGGGFGPSQGDRTHATAFPAVAGQGTRGTGVSPVQEPGSGFPSLPEGMTAQTQDPSSQQSRTPPQPSAGPARENTTPGEPPPKIGFKGIAPGKSRSDHIRAHLGPPVGGGNSSVEYFEGKSCGVVQAAVAYDEEGMVCCARVKLANPLSPGLAEIAFQLAGPPKQSQGNFFDENLDEGWTGHYREKGIHLYVSGGVVQEVWMTLPEADLEEIRDGAAKGLKGNDPSGGQPSQ